MGLELRQIFVSSVKSGSSKSLRFHGRTSKNVRRAAPTSKVFDQLIFSGDEQVLKHCCHDFISEINYAYQQTRLEALTAKHFFSSCWLFLKTREALVRS
jgi:hypothetical protein